MKKIGQLSADKDFIARLKMEAWDLRAKGFTQSAIAKKLDITQASVSRYLKDARSEYHALYTKRIKQVITEQVAFHDHVAEEAMIAWENSKSSFAESGKKTPKKVIKRGKSSRSNSDVEQITEFREDAGNHYYLQVAMTAKEKIRKILGTDAPIKLQTNASNSGTISVERAADIISEFIGSNEERNTSKGNTEDTDSS